MITIEFIVIILCLLIGTRFGGMGLGLISGIGLFILGFVFGLQPGKPPVDVMLTILAVIGCAATLQTAGGLNVMMQFAERLLRKHPQHITLLAPFTTWMLTFLCGTGHVVYTMFPIIADIALKKAFARNGRWRWPRWPLRWRSPPPPFPWPSFRWSRFWVRSTASVTRGGSSKSSPFPYRPHCLASPLRHCGACAGEKPRRRY